MPPAGLATGQRPFKTVRLSVQGCLCLINQCIHYYLKGRIAFNGPPNKGHIIPSCDTIFSNSTFFLNGKCLLVLPAPHHRPPAPPPLGNIVRFHVSALELCEIV